MDDQKAQYARRTSARTLADTVAGADIFLGLSAAGVLKPEMVEAMAEKPLILALANPDPEIRPEVAKIARPDAIIATGRSDYPNQVNNLLCFPFMFRGALDVGASTINEEMKLAAVRAIAELAQAEQSDVVTAAYGTQDIVFGPDYLIPRPFDPRLITKVAPAVAQAAMDSGVATRPLAGPRRLSPLLAAVRLHVRHGHAAGLRRRGRVVAPAHRLRRGRGRPLPARGAGRRRRGSRGPRSRRQAGRHRAEDQGARTAPRGGPRRRDRELRRRIGPRRSRRGLLPASQAARPVARRRRGRDAPQHHPDRRDAAERRQGGRAPVRHVRVLRGPPPLCRGGDRPRRGRARLRRDEPPAAAAAHALHLRHLHSPRPDGGRARRHGRPRGRGAAGGSGRRRASRSCPTPISGPPAIPRPARCATPSR